MFCRQTRQLRFLAIVSIFFIILPLIVIGAEKGRQSKDGNIEGWVSHINKDVLYIDGQEYSLSGNTRVFLGEENSWEITLNTITDVGHIHKARVYLERGMVLKIVVLEVQQ